MTYSFLSLLDLDPQVIIVLMIIIVGGLQKLVEVIKGNKDGQDAIDQAAEEFEDLYEEARREILERQTEVHETEPSIPPVREPTAYQTPPAPAPPPLPDWQREVVKPTLSAAERAALARLQTHSTARPKRSRSRSNIRRLLSSPGSARDAIVLSEILGPPKGASS